MKNSLNSNPNNKKNKWFNNFSVFKKIKIIRDWDYGKVKVTHLSFGLLKFQKLYDREKLFYRYIFLIITAILTGIASYLFFQNTGIYNLGMAGLFQGLSRVTASTMIQNALDANPSFSTNPELLNAYVQSTVQPIYTSLFWLLNVVFNLPLTIFGFYKIGKQFAILTLTFIVASSLAGLLMSFIPGINDFYIFSDPKTNEIQLIQKNIQILQWDYATPNQSQNDQSRIIILLIYSLFAATLPAILSAIAFTLGSSTGGSDWVSFYIVKMKQKSIGTITFYVNISFMILAIFIGTYIPYLRAVINDHNNTEKLIQNFFSPMLIFTILIAYIRKWILDILYPQFKIINAKIYSSKVREIREFLIKQKFMHAFTINKVIGGYSLIHSENLEMTAFYVELPEILSIVRKFDKNCLIVATPVVSMDGSFRIKSTIN